MDRMLGWRVADELTELPAPSRALAVVLGHHSLYQPFLNGPVEAHLSETCPRQQSGDHCACYGAQPPVLGGTHRTWAGTEELGEELRKWGFAPSVCSLEAGIML